MNSPYDKLYKKAREHLEDFDWRGKVEDIPIVGRLIPSRSTFDAAEYWYKKYRNVEAERDDYKAKWEYEKKNPIKYGLPGYPSEDHNLDFIGTSTEGVSSGYQGIFIEDEYDKERFDSWQDKPQPLILAGIGDKSIRSVTIDPNEKIQYPYPRRLDLDISKLSFYVEGKNDEDILDQFDKTRIGEAVQIRALGLGLEVWAISNENRVREEVAKKVPMTLYSHMEPRDVTKITTKRHMEPWEGEYEERDLPGKAAYALIKRYPHNRLKIELYDEEDNLLNPSIEDNDVTKDPEPDSVWTKIKKYYGFN
jgi:hypothetical protein